MSWILFYDLYFIVFYLLHLLVDIQYSKSNIKFSKMRPRYKFKQFCSKGDTIKKKKNCTQLHVKCLFEF